MELFFNMTNEKIIEIASHLNWKANVENGNYLFQMFSPAGKDFCIELSSPDIKSLKEDLAAYIDNFDVSYETYLWLDESGHGINGAPYDMMDVYVDTKWCLDATLELYRELFAY